YFRWRVQLRKHIRVIISTARHNLIAFYRLFSLNSFALRFFLPFMTMATAWILYRVVFGSENLKASFGVYSSLDYLTFVIIGQAIFVYMYATVFQVGRVFYWERMGGTIESLFLSPVSRRAYMLGHVCYAMLNATLDFIIIFIAGIFIFEVRITYLNPILLFIGIGMTVVSLFGVGLVVNAITLSLRDRTNTANILTLIFFIFSGAIVPIEMLPEWGKLIGQILPLTYSLKIIRGTIVPDVTIFDFTEEVLILIFISLLLLVIGFIFLIRIERSLKQKGELTVF
ncbi:MAG: ABC transporter permease, partial [Candidatus Hodarchaeota archaeon]